MRAPSFVPYPIAFYSIANQAFLPYTFASIYFAIFEILPLSKVTYSSILQSYYYYYY